MSWTNGAGDDGQALDRHQERDALFTAALSSPSLASDSPPMIPGEIDRTRQGFPTRALRPALTPQGSCNQTELPPCRSTGRPVGEARYRHGIHSTQCSLRVLCYRAHPPAHPLRSLISRMKAHTTNAKADAPINTQTIAAADVNGLVLKSSEEIPMAPNASNTMANIIMDSNIRRVSRRVGFGVCVRLDSLAGSTSLALSAKRTNRLCFACFDIT